MNMNLNQEFMVFFNDKCQDLFIIFIGFKKMFKNSFNIIEICMSRFMINLSEETFNDAFSL